MNSIEKENLNTNPIIITAEYISSSVSIADLPPPKLPEYAFIGRSNVGKSSLINYLSNQTDLAKVSASPGKTRTINHFLFEKKWYLVDLPGYGFAKVAKQTRLEFQKMLENYFLMRANLMCIFLLLDSRHGILKNDQTFLTFLGENQLPTALIMTKIDKLSQADRLALPAKLTQALAKEWDPIPEIFYTSAEKKIGREAIIERIRAWNSYFGIESQNK
jgi:GTP-binding protein